MPESPIATLERWEDSGADWRVVALGEEHVTIELLTCHGEPVDVLESEDPQLLRWLRARGGSSGA